MVGGWLRRYWLAVWFGALSGIALGELLASGGSVTGDAELYLAATRRWLDGQNPYTSPIGDWWFVAPPPTLLVMLPFTIVPPDIGKWIVLGTTILAGVVTVRALHRPWWWLLFPPLLLAMLGNPQAWLVPLILLSPAWLAPIAKIYAGPVLILLGRWKDLAIMTFVLVVSAPFLPWRDYIEAFPATMGHLREQTAGFSAVDVPILLPVALVGLVLVGREHAAWLVTPVLWPRTQWYYQSLAMPALTPLAAAIAALPIPGAIVGALIVIAYDRRRDRVQVAHDRRAPGPAPGVGSS